MRIRIKTYNGELPSYLTVGKEYDCFVNFGDISFPDDIGVQTYIDMDNCRHLNGGSWEVCDEWNKYNLGYTGRQAFEAGKQSQQAKIDDLQGRIDGALKYMNDFSRGDRRISCEAIEWVLKGNKDDI